MTGSGPAPLGAERAAELRKKTMPAFL